MQEGRMSSELDKICDAIIARYPDLPQDKFDALLKQEVNEEIMSGNKALTQEMIELVKRGLEQ
jgi:hypothetical protein